MDSGSCYSCLGGEQFGEVHFLQFQLLPLRVPTLILVYIRINLKNRAIEKNIELLNLNSIGIFS